MKNSFRLAAITLFVICLTVEGVRFPVFAQDPSVIAIRPVLKDSGWKIPGLERSRVTDGRKELLRKYGAASHCLHVTVLEPSRRFTTTIPIFRLKDGQTLTITERRVVVDSIIKCDINNRVFAYILHCTIILEEPNGLTGYSGTFGVHYYDRDGDGKFESFEEGPPFVTRPSNT